MTIVLQTQTQTANTNQMENVSNFVDHFLQSDSCFHHLLDKLKVTQTTGFATVSGLQDSDYPHLSEFNNLRSLSQFSNLTTIPLPNGLLQQFDYMQQNCEMGLFTCIGRAWIAIDSNVYLWSYDNSSDVAYYDGLTHTIISVGLSKPKPGIFKPHIKYLLIVTTAVEILLLGITFTNNDDSDNLGDLLLVPEPIFSVSTDNVVMNVIRGTNDGRIFFGGKDGHLYEVVYQAEEGWFSRKCKKVNHSLSTFSFLIPSFLNYKKEDCIIQIEVDESRHILYTLSESGNIDVYDLGVDGNDANKVAHKSLDSIIQESIFVARTVDQTNFSSITSINAIEESEAIHIHLIAITRTGFRLYFSTCSLASPEQRPFTLTLVHIRLPPGFTASSPPQRPTSVHISNYKRGNLLMISSISEGKDVLWALNHDSFGFSSDLMELYTVVPLNSKVWKMVEEEKCLPFKPYHSFVLKNNKLVAIEPPLLVTQHIEEPRKFIFLTSQGVHIGFKPRIVDQLQQILTENQGFDNEPVKAFFSLHNCTQSCAVALILACSCKSPLDSKISEWATSAFFYYGGEPQLIPSYMQQQQHLQYQSPTHVQHISTPVSSVNQPLFTSASSPIRPLSPALPDYNYSQSVIRNPIISSPAVSSSSSVQFSDKHNAVFLYFSRIIRPFWNLKTVRAQQTVTIDGPKELLLSNILSKELKLYESKLIDLKRFMENNIKFSLSGDTIETAMTTKASHTSKVQFTDSVNINNDALSKERNSLYMLMKLIEHCTEVLGLWKLLCDHQFYAIVSVLSAERQTQLTAITFRELIVFGNEMTTLLASALVQRYIEDNSTTDLINKRLQQVCPSIYKTENALHAKAHEMVIKSKSISNVSEKEMLLTNALNLCKKIGARINLESICDLFQSVQKYEAIVDLCLITAQNRDPQNLALHYYRSGEQIDDQIAYFAFVARNECYRLLLEMYERLVQQSKSMLNTTIDDITKSRANVIFINSNEAKKLANDMLSLALKSNDELFHIASYNWLYEHQQSEKLLEIKSPYLESYLKRKTSSFSDSVALMDLLWMYYERNANFRAAAQILCKLAERRSNEVNLYSRLEYLSRAIVCMKSSDSRPSVPMEATKVSAGEFLHELEEKMEVARIQLQLLENLQQLDDSPNVSEAIATLNSDLLDITHLYEEFANRFNFYECQLAIVHCAGHYDPNLIETLWQNIIDSEMRAISSQPIDTQITLLRNKIKELGKQYLQSDKYFPHEFIVKYLETITQNFGFDAHWLIKTLLELSISIDNLLDLYHKLYKSREYGNTFARKPIHLLRIIVYIINLFASSPSIVPLAERRIFVTKCLDVISGYLIDLQSMDSEDKLVKEIISDLRGARAKLERF